MAKQKSSRIPLVLSAVTSGLTFIAFVLDVQDRLQNPRALHVASVVTFVLFAAAILWLVVSTSNAKWRWVELAVLYAASCLYFTWVGTWIAPPARVAVVIDAMDAITDWQTLADDKGSGIEIASAPSNATPGMKITYTVNQYGWVEVTRPISSGALDDSTAIGFTYQGTGAPNTIEFMLVYAPDATGKMPTFSRSWNRATDHAAWTLLEARYNSFVCGEPTGCLPGETVDPHRVARVEIAISNKAGDTPGAGAIVVDDLQAVTYQPCTRQA